MHAFFMAVVLAVAYAFADRLADGRRSASIVAACCAGLGFLFWGLPGLAFAACWWGWRMPTMSVIRGASNAPDSWPEVRATFLRHCFAPGMLGLAAGLTGHDALKMTITFAVWALFATALASWNGRQMAKDALDDPDEVVDYTPVLECVRGAAFGVALVMGVG